MRSTVRATAVLMLAAIAVGSCTQQETTQPADQIAVQPKWFHQSQFAGFYVADVNEYYATERLEVSFIEGGPNIDVYASVLAGEASFGIDGGGALVVARAEGTPVRAIATIYRRNPRVLVAAADSGITRPQDFVGQAVLTSLSAIPTLRAMLGRVGVTPEQYTVLTAPYDVSLFDSGATQVWDVYLTGSIHILLETGYELNIIYPDDYGVHVYADTIFATEELVAAEPELVTRFLRATLRGWTYAIEKPDAMGAIVLQYNPQADVALETTKMIDSVPLIHTGEDHIGWMQAEVWQGTYDMLLDQGLLHGPVDVDTIYTMEFLQSIYGDHP